MGETTGIAWTDHTFNPWWGCQRVSPGCTNCYAESWDRRWAKLGTVVRAGGSIIEDALVVHWGPESPRRFFGDAHWNEPRKWNKAAAKEGRRARVFCASMADVFEDRRDLDSQRARPWALITETPSLDWQLLTKRPENVPVRWPFFADGHWPANVWLGTTVEDRERAERRIPALARVPAKVRFLSCEPLLEDIGRPDLSAIDWLIIGGESGAGARPMDLAWARGLLRHASCAVFVKQLGGARDKRDDPADWPDDLRVREFPESIAPNPLPVKQSSPPAPSGSTR